MASQARAAAPAFRLVRRTPRIHRMPATTGSVANNGRPRISMPLGVTYLALMPRFTIAGVAATEAQIKAQVLKIQCIIDGDNKIDCTPAELIAIEEYWNKRHGLACVNDGVLRISLSRPWEQEIDAQDGPGWGCAVNVVGGVGNFTMIFEMAGASVTIDGIEVHAEVTDPAPLGRHLCLRRYGFSSTQASGDVTFSDFNTGVDHSAYAFHLDKASAPEASAPITHVQLYADQAFEIEKIPTGTLEALAERYGLTKATGFTHIPFARRGRPKEGLPMVAQDMRLLLTVGSALNATNLISEQLEGVDPEPLAAA